MALEKNKFDTADRLASAKFSTSSAGERVLSEQSLHPYALPGGDS